MTTPRADLTGHPGVTDTFVHPCHDCGETMHVVGGVEQPHAHKVLTEDDGTPAVFAWWQGYDAAHEAGRDDRTRLRKVREIHSPVDAVDYGRNPARRSQVCAGCGTDNGNWQVWPCPTIRAIEGAR
jgi:hypothetical protein